MKFNRKNIYREIKALFYVVYMFSFFAYWLIDTDPVLLFFVAMHFFLLIASYVNDKFYHSIVDLKNDSINSYKDIIKLQKESLDDYQRRDLGFLDDFLSKYFDGTEITKWVISVGSKNLTVKIGDDDNMVDVPMPVSGSTANMVELLEKAVLDWKSRNV